MTAPVSIISAENPIAVVFFTHGSGTDHTSTPMSMLAHAMAENGFCVVSFDMPFMAERRETGRRRPPPRVANLVPEVAAQLIDLKRRLPDLIDADHSGLPLFMAGKSLGGRVATLLVRDNFEPLKLSIEDENNLRAQVSELDLQGAVAFGYPFHPPKKPETLRTTHLSEPGARARPVFIAHGTRDTFGTPAEIASYRFPSDVTVKLIEDGDHDLIPRKSSNRTPDQNWHQAACFAGKWVKASGRF